MIKKIIIVISICLAVALLPFFLKKTSLTQSHTKPFILCTTSIIGDTVKQIVGDTAEIYTLMGPGIDPHLYKAREGDVHRLAHADIIFYNGLHLEGKMVHVLHQINSYTRSAAVADALKPEQLLSAGVGDTYDPHIWHDVICWIQVVEYITATLCSRMPEYSAKYEKNSRIFSAQLHELDKYIKSKIAAIPESQRILITAHDAFGYFGKRYGMQVVGLQGVSTDAEISTSDVQNLVDYLVANQVHAIFIESSIPKRSIQAVHNAAAARDWYVIIGEELYSDAIGDAESSANSYSTMIKHNIDAIVQALAKQ